MTEGYVAEDRERYGQWFHGTNLEAADDKAQRRTFARTYGG